MLGRVKVVIPGGTGQVGGLLRRALSAHGHEVVVLSRHPGELEPGIRHVGWDGRTLGPWAAEVDGADAVVNLAGRTVSCRYTPENLQQMMDSRVESTPVVGRAIAQAGTAWMAEVGAWVLRTDTELLLKSRRVVPGRLLDAGFEFEHPQWPEAATDLVQRVRSRER
jgi:NAD dependent epimerase/dehydratase family enzyme